MEMDSRTESYRFESLEALKKHIEGQGMNMPYIACPDREEDRWTFGKSRLWAAVGALRMAPYLKEAEHGADGYVFEVMGCDSIKDLPTFPEFVAGCDWAEAWDKTLAALDDLVPLMPVSTFSQAQLEDMLAGV